MAVDCESYSSLLRTGYSVFTKSISDPEKTGEKTGERKERKKKKNSKNTLEFIWVFTFGRKQGRFRHGTERFGEKQVEPSQSAAMARCTIHHCRWGELNLGDRNL